MKFRPVGAELSHANVQTGRQTDKTKLMVVFVSRRSSARMWVVVWMGHFNTIKEPTGSSNRQLLGKIMTLELDCMIKKKSGLGNAQLRCFVESRGESGGSYSGAHEDSVPTQYDAVCIAVWVPTLKRAFLSPSSNYSKTPLTCTVATGRWHYRYRQQALRNVGRLYMFQSTWRQEPQVSLWAICFLQQVQTCSEAHPLPIQRVPGAPFLGAEVVGSWNWSNTWT